MFAVLVLLYAPAAGPEVTTIEQLENEIISHRRRVNSGEMTFRQTAFINGERDLKRDGVFEYWFVGDKLRRDEWRGFELEHPHRLTKCKNCERPNSLTMYTNERVNGLTRVPLDAAL